jgi:antitoxin (DNA-binding transcriptional repressor) of toxin-antitoxin stability system
MKGLPDLRLDWFTGLVHTWNVQTFNIHEAKAQFSRILRQIERGEEVLIARGGVVIARIVPERVPRGFQIGRDVGKGSIADDFDAPLPEFEPYE